MQQLIDRIYFSMVDYYAGDPKRIQHFVKVHSFSRLIAAAEGMSGRELDTLEAAALVHDIGIKAAEAKYGSSSGKYQELEGPALARELLLKCGAPEDLIARACYLVGHHHTYTAIDGLDYQILVEADFLVNLFEDELPASAALSVRRKIFKTKTGTQLLSTMFALGPEA